LGCKVDLYLKIFKRGEGDFINNINKTEKSDFEIIDEVLNGDVSAFEIIVKKYEKMLYNLAMSKLRHKENAQDIVQECFLRAYKMLRSYRTDSAFSTWVYRICQNLIYDFYRKNKKTQEISLSAASDDDNSDAIKEREVADISQEPSEIVIRQEKIAKIRELIESLPDDLREIIILRDINNYSYVKISEMLDIEIGTVKSRLSRAREKLKKYITENNKNRELF